MTNPNSPTPPEQPEQTRAAAADSLLPFQLGDIVATANAAEQLSRSIILIAIARHCSGDWGEVCEEDRKLNDEALRDGNRIHSVYTTPGGVTFWIITEWDRSVTTVLLPDDY